jgi:hypothetical protein
MPLLIYASSACHPDSVAGILIRIFVRGSMAGLYTKGSIEITC